MEIIAYLNPGFKGLRGQLISLVLANRLLAYLLIVYFRTSNTIRRTLLISYGNKKKMLCYYFYRFNTCLRL
jgi:hypothetical protein